MRSLNLGFSAFPNELISDEQFKFSSDLKIIRLPLAGKHLSLSHKICLNFLRLNNGQLGQTPKRTY